MEPAQFVRILVVEDDPFQQSALREIMNQVAAKSAFGVEAVVVASGAEALAACGGGKPLARGAKSAFDLVLLDYLLPGGNADTVLPALRGAVGDGSAIVLLSGAEQEGLMQRALLEMGADSYRFKPVSTAHVSELVHYAMQKRRAFASARKRPQSDVADRSLSESGSTEKHSSPSPSPEPDRKVGRPSEPTEPNSSNASSPQGDLLSNGRRGPVLLGADDDGRPVAVKVLAAELVRGAPPPSHPNVNRVIDRTVQGGRILERRELCDGGELLDVLVLEGCDDDLGGEAASGASPPGDGSPGDGGLPLARALFWFRQLAAAVAHCHAHGAVHGQLHPENVLLRGAETLQVVGFSSCAAGGGGGGGNGEGEGVALRLTHPDLDAPELVGRLHCGGADELRACDVWALGLLLVCLLTGAPSTAVGRESRDDVGGVARSVSDLDVTEAAMAVSRASLATQKLSHSMLQPSPARRPTAAAVLAQVDALLLQEAEGGAA